MLEINLPPEQLSYLNAQVSAGHYPTMDKALSAAVAALEEKMPLEQQGDDFSDPAYVAWVKQQLAPAQASLARGEGVPFDMSAIFAELKAKKSKNSGKKKSPG